MASINRISFASIIIISFIIPCCLLTISNHAFCQCIEGNCVNGIGTFVSSDGGKYVGEFKKGHFDGHGTLTSIDGRKYVGEFKNGFLDGQGTFTFPDGTKYVGEFKNNQEDGQGTFTFPDGTKYVGESKKGLFDGQGTLTSIDGRKYVGGFKNGKIEGHGTATYADGRRYVGEFKNNQWDGQGTLTYADGRRYVGQFKEYKFHGQGTYTWPDGVAFEGTFDNDMPQPPFELLLPDGTKRLGKISKIVKIIDIFENSQAQNIGLKKDDIIIEYNNNIAMSSAMLSHLVSQTKPEDNVSMIIRREGKDLRLALKGGKIGIRSEDFTLYSLQGKAQKVATTSTMEIKLPNETSMEDIVDLKSAIPSKEVFGKYYALVIGNNNYTYLPKLK